MLRRTCGIGTIALLAAGLAGCATEPEPAWTEEEAYAAAEETYEKYWSTTSDDTADPLELLTPEMVEIHLEGEKQLKELGVELRGKTVIESFDITTFRLVDGQAVVSAESCVDGSAVEVRSDGSDWGAPRDDPTYGLKIDFESVDSTMLIASLDEAVDIEC